MQKRITINLSLKTECITQSVEYRTFNSKV
jgi:hypothetical protein